MTLAHIKKQGRIITGNQTAGMTIESLGVNSVSFRGSGNFQYFQKNSGIPHS